MATMTGTSRPQAHHCARSCFHPIPSDHRGNMKMRPMAVEAAKTSAARNSHERASNCLNPIALRFFANCHLSNFSYARHPALLTNRFRKPGRTADARSASGKKTWLM